MKFKFKQSYIVLILIICLAIFLRTVNLDISPPGFNADEAALGYNAYSILKTGKDEWGQFLPLVFKSFSDYKPGIYVYLDIPFVALMGLTELAVRMPSIIFGSLSVLLIYLLGKEIFIEEIPAISAALLLSISPWHIHFSRGAWETNVSTFFILLGIWAFIKGLKLTKWLFVSSFSLILAMYTYQSPRVVVPVLVMAILGFYFKKLFVKKNILLAVLSFIVLIPFVFLTFNSTGLARFQGLSIFNDPGPQLTANVDRGEYSNPKSFQAIFFHNKIINYSISFLGHYTDNFSPSFLFISGDPLGRNKIPEMGQMYIFEIITFLVGLYFVIKKDYKNKKLIFIWLFAAPIASALTYQTPSALRDFNMVIPLTLISGLGLGLIIQSVTRLNFILKYSTNAFIILVISFSVFRFLDLYFVHLPKQYSLEWEYGFSQIASYIKDQGTNYQKIEFTNTYDQPYILLLFYLKYDPKIYQENYKHSIITSYGFSTIASFDKYVFGPVSRNDVNSKEKTLIIGTPQELNGVSPILYSVPYPNGKNAFIVTSSNGYSK